MAATELSLCGDIWSNVQVSARSAIRYNSLVLKRFEFQVPKFERRTRLEDFLFDRVGELSRMYLRDVVKGGLCQVNGRFENVGYRLRPGVAEWWGRVCGAVGHIQAAGAAVPWEGRTAAAG